MTVRKIQRTLATHQLKKVSQSTTSTPQAKSKTSLILQFHSKFSNSEIQDQVEERPNDKILDQDSSLTVTVAAILISYLICNIPANLILLIDPSATSYTSFHLPCYILAWLSSIVKAICYIACTHNFRASLMKSLKRFFGSIKMLTCNVTE